MAGHAVAVDRCSVGPRRRKQRFALVATVGLLGIHAKTDLLRIEIAGSHAEFLRTLGRRREQPVERGHGAVVKVGRGGPDTVQRTGAIMRSVWLGIGTVLARAPEFVALLLGGVLIGHPFPAD